MLRQPVQCGSVLVRQDAVLFNLLQSAVCLCARQVESVCGVEVMCLIPPLLDPFLPARTSHQPLHAYTPQIEKLAKEKGVELILPSDVVIADKFAADANTKVARPHCIVSISHPSVLAAGGVCVFLFVCAVKQCALTSGVQSLVSCDETATMSWSPTHGGIGELFVTACT
jgi:hypothetical protein